MDRTAKTNRIAFLGCLLVAGTLFIFWPVLSASFVGLDDGYYVTLNSRVRSGLTWGGMWWALHTGFEASWHPLTWLSHMLDAQLFGLNPAGHHSTNLLLHTANVLLLFTLLQRITGATWRSAFVAALFAFHPLHVEPVAWVSSRKDVLSTFFFLLTLSAYAKYVGVGQSGKDQSTAANDPAATKPPVSPRTHWYCLSLLCFACGLMSKAMVVTLPCVLLLLDWWPLQRLQFDSRSSRIKALFPLIREKVPFFALCAVSSIVTALVMGTAAKDAQVAVPLGPRLGNAVASYGRYLSHTIWPAGLTLFYPHPSLGYAAAHPGQPFPLRLWLTWQVAAGVLLLIAVSLLALLRRRRQPWFAVGWFWYLGTLVPVIGVLQVGSHAMADRYTYVPLIGIFIVVVWGVGELFRGRFLRTVMVPVMSVAVLLACLVVTYRQLGFWRDNETAFTHALEVTGANSVALDQLGHGYAAKGNLNVAMTLYRAAIAAEPGFAAAAYGDLGALLEKEGHPQEAFAVYQTGLKRVPWAIQLENSLGNLLAGLGRQDEALAHYRAAIRAQPDYPDARYNLGLILTSRGDWPEAAKQFAAVVALKPNDPDALTCLAEALLNQGRTDQAEERFRQAIGLSPTNAPAHLQLAVLLAQKEKLDEAFSHFQAAAKLRPDWPDALNGIAWLLATDPRPEKRNGLEAVRLAERVCSLTDRRKARFLSTLDAAYAEAGRFQAAIHTAEEARALALAAGQTALVEAVDARLILYRKGLAFRQ